MGSQNVRKVNKFVKKKKFRTNLNEKLITRKFKGNLPKNKFCNDNNENSIQNLIKKLDYHTRCRRYGEALAAFIKINDLKFNIASYLKMINCCVRAGQLDNAIDISDKFFIKVSSLSIKHIESIYSCLIKGYGNCLKFDKVYELYRAYRMNVKFLYSWLNNESQIDESPIENPKSINTRILNHILRAGLKTGAVLECLLIYEYHKSSIDYTSVLLILELGVRANLQNFCENEFSQNSQLFQIDKDDNTSYQMIKITALLECLLLLSEINFKAYREQFVACKEILASIIENSTKDSLINFDSDNDLFEDNVDQDFVFCADSRDGTENNHQTNLDYEESRELFLKHRIKNIYHEYQELSDYMFENNKNNMELNEDCYFFIDFENKESRKINPSILLAAIDSNLDIIRNLLHSNFIEKLPSHEKLICRLESNLSESHKKLIFEKNESFKRLCSESDYFVDIGTGNGEWAINQNGEHQWILNDIRWNRTRKILVKICLKKAVNIKFVLCGDAKILFKSFLINRNLSGVFIRYPEVPFIFENTYFDVDFIESLSDRMKNDAIFIIETDNKKYAQWISGYIIKKVLVKLASKLESITKTDLWFYKIRKNSDKKLNQSMSYFEKLWDETKKNTFVFELKRIPNDESIIH